MALQDGLASRRRLERPRRVRGDEAAQGRLHLRRGQACQQHLRQGVRQRQEQGHRAAEDLASARGFHPQAEPRQEGAGAGHRAARRAAGGSSVLTIASGRGPGATGAFFRAESVSGLRATHPIGAGRAISTSQNPFLDRDGHMSGNPTNQASGSESGNPEAFIVTNSGLSSAKQCGLPRPWQPTVHHRFGLF